MKIINLEEYKRDKEALATFREHGEPPHPFHQDDEADGDKCRLCTHPSTAAVHYDPFEE